MPFDTALAARASHSCIALSFSSEYVFLRGLVGPCCTSALLIAAAASAGVAELVASRARSLGASALYISATYPDGIDRMITESEKIAPPRREGLYEPAPIP